ncbi:replicative DNA helicase [Rhodospirillaceae bacterium SYSU D60014]|uniref:replicative DNA helicase n=1 Tax=Virgifigura deserti TaxID=2268457 RepID=UPI000E66143C
MERGSSGSAIVTPLRGGDETPVRVPPHNYEAEQALLGAILANNLVLDRVSEFLLPEHFADAVHGRIYEAATKLIQRGQIANVLTLKNMFDQDTALTEVGGAQYLARLANAVVTIINAEDYGRTIHDMYLRRQLVDLGEEVVNDAFTFDLDIGAMDQIEKAEQQLYQLAETGQTEKTLQPLMNAIATAITNAEAAYKRDSHITGVTVGLTDIDKKLGGLHPSDLIILAGRPSMGKTALATNMAFNAAYAHMKSEGKEGGQVAFFSLEMSSEQLATRILAERTEISSDRIRRGDLREDDFPKFVAAAQDLHRIPFFIDDTPALTVSGLRTRARRLKRQHGLGMIVIDYLQLMRPTAGSRSENRVQEISDITRGLKAIAKELDVPVLALSQLSRAVEQREDKRPQLADLRESGSIEQDADVVMFVFREQYYHERSEPKQRDDESNEKFNERVDRYQEKGARIHNVAEVNIAKQRHGPIGTVELFFDGMVTRFSDLVRDDHLPHDHP